MTLLPPQTKVTLTEDEILSILPDINSTCNLLITLSLLSQQTTCLCVSTVNLCSAVALLAGWWRRCRPSSGPFLMRSQTGTRSWSCPTTTCPPTASRTVWPSELL